VLRFHVRGDARACVCVCGAPHLLQGPITRAPKDLKGGSAARHFDWRQWGCCWKGQWKTPGKKFHPASRAQRTLATWFQ
jgi:hypothetical protein